MQKVFNQLIKWTILCLIIGILSGLASGFFLYSLELVTQLREENLWIIALLPLGGLLIGFSYHKYGTEAVKGNNLIFDEYNHPQKKIPFIMFPLVLFGTLITHLFGGSAGREGTAVQMGAVIADQCKRWFTVSSEERRILLICGISAGFASVFGTPLAGAIFAIEVLFFSKVKFKSILPSFLVAYIAFYTVEFLPIHHTHYAIPTLPELSLETIGWSILVGIPFGLTAMLFSKSTHAWHHLFKKYIHFPPLRPFIGGIMIASVVFFMGSTKFIGLGIPTILDAFQNQQIIYIFLLKILFTGFTLGAGFKGGEVTPLFFIGATLGSFLSTLVPLPVALLAGMGFVAVFAGATHTPIACTVMGIELFGIETGVYLMLACSIAYFFSGEIGIYTSQLVEGPKRKLYNKFRRKIIEDL